MKRPNTLDPEQWHVLYQRCLKGEHICYRGEVWLGKQKNTELGDGTDRKIARRNRTWLMLQVRKKNKMPSGFECQ